MHYKSTKGERKKCATGGCTISVRLSTANNVYVNALPENLINDHNLFHLTADTDNGTW